MREKVRFCVALCCSVVMVLLASCRYSLPDLPAEGMSRKTKDSLTYLSKYHYTWNTNLEVLDDSVRLEYLPLKDAYVNLYKGDRVVVSEFSVHPQDSVDSIWVKVAHSQEVQGWVRNKELVRSFVPTDSISQFIHLFSDTHASYFVFIFALFVGVYLLRAFMKKRLQMVYLPVDGIQRYSLRDDAGVCTRHLGAFLLQSHLVSVQGAFHSFGIPDRHLAVYHRHFGRT